MFVGCLVHALFSTVVLPVALQSQREDPDAIYGTVDDNVYAAVGNAGQSYYSMVCIHLHVVCICLCVCIQTFVYEIPPNIPTWKWRVEEEEEVCVPHGYVGTHAIAGVGHYYYSVCVLMCTVWSAGVCVCTVCSACSC